LAAPRKSVKDLLFVARRRAGRRAATLGSRMIRHVIPWAGAPMPSAPPMQGETIGRTIKAILSMATVLAAVLTVATVRRGILALAGLLRLILRLAAAGDE
jgi:hypothetical protein